MKIIITGALGHIGSSLFIKLSEVFKNIPLILIDNLSTQRYCSLFKLPKGQFKFIEADLLQYDISELISENDIVIHLAAMTDAANSVKKSEQVFNNNYLTTKRIATSCSKNKAKLIYPSSTSVYGVASSIMYEDTAISNLKPQSPYAGSKIEEEKILQSLSLEQDLKMIIFRFGTICGTSNGMRFHTAINKFCWQAVMQQPITIWETAYKQKRPYLDLEDAINVIIHVIKNDLFDNQIYNIATDNCTVEHIIKIIKNSMPRISINFIKETIMNQLSYEVSTDKIKSTSFSFKGSINSRIKDTIKQLQNSNTWQGEGT